MGTRNKPGLLQEVFLIAEPSFQPFPFVLLCSVFTNHSVGTIISLTIDQFEEDLNDIRYSSPVSIYLDH